MEEKKSGSITREQKRVLIQFMEDHPELKTSKFTKEFTFKKGQALWEEIALILNAMPGAKKEWVKWRKTWHDIKNAVKTKKSNIRRHLVETGGGPPINEEMTDEDQKVLDLISPVVIEGMPEVAESVAVLRMPSNKDINSSISSSLILSDVEVIVSDPIVEQAVEPSVEADLNKNQMFKNSIIEPLATPSQPKNSKTTRTPVRVRRLDRSIGASEKMAKIMEHKNNIYENYLKEKLSLMRRDCEVKERIAAALERLTALHGS